MAPNEKQREAWNGTESAFYVENAERFDRHLAPFTEALLTHLRSASPRRVLDVGCGCGGLTLAAARIADSAVGLDISAPLTQVASERARASGVDNADFVVADAQTHAFEPGSYDVVVSQFGLMFFDDPLTAFSNLRRALAPGGRLAFISWQGLNANEWLTVVAREVAQHAEIPELGGLSRGPGMFALMEQDETTALLAEAGFTEVVFTPLAPTLTVVGGGPLDESTSFLLGNGMVRGLIGMVPAETQDAVVDAIRLSLAKRYEPGVGLRLGAAAWLVTALG